MELGKNTMRIEGGVAILTLSLKANDAYYSRARLKLEYWPDPINFPQLKLTPAPGGANFAEVSE